MEKFKQQDPSLMGRIRGCIVDSAPVAAPDPQVNDTATFMEVFIDMFNETYSHVGEEGGVDFCYCVSHMAFLCPIRNVHPCFLLMSGDL